MTEIFRLIKPAPLWVQVRSRECSSYMYRVMKCVGWIPPKKGMIRYVYLFWSCLVIGLGTLYMPVGFVLSIIKDFKNFTPAEFLNVLQITLNTFGTTTKTIIVLMFLSRIHRSNLLLDKLDERLKSDPDRQKIHQAVAHCNYLFSIYGGFYFWFLLSVFITGMLTNRPPLLVYNPLFDWRNGVASLWMQAILECIIALMMASMLLIVDTCVLIFMITFRAHIAVLKDHIRNLRMDPHKTEAENYEEMVCCIVDHKLILDCCEVIRPIMSFSILTQFLLVGVVLGVTMINIMYFLGIVRGFSSIVYFTGILMESFPLCYLCDLIAEDLKDLSNLLGHSQWIDAEFKYKSTLMIFMHHVQKPTNFKAGGMLPISMMSNIQMAKVAFSVMTLVQKLNLSDRFT